MKRIITVLAVAALMAVMLGTAGQVMAANFKCEKANPQECNGTDSADNIEGNNDPNMIYGKGGDDVIRGNGGNDVIHGNAGKDKLYGDALRHNHDHRLREAARGSSAARALSPARNGPVPQRPRRSRRRRAPR